MLRLVVDSGLYIDWLNARRHEGILFGGEGAKYLSAVVLMELRAGAFDVRTRRVIHDLEGKFISSGRVLTPTAAIYAEAGDVLRRLQSERGYNLKRGHPIVNDVLIALSARSMGATVVTQNAADFRAIQGIRGFPLRVVSA
jgi:predicted nucleic acid-binding protein